MYQIVLPNDFNLEITKDGFINLRSVIKEMTGKTNVTRELQDFYNSLLFNSVSTQLLDEARYSPLVRKLPTDRTTPSLVHKDVLTAYLIYSSSEFSIKWQTYFITVIMPEYERLKTRELQEQVQQEHRLRVVAEEKSLVQELIRTRDTFALRKKFTQQELCDLLRDSSDYRAGGYISPTDYAALKGITLAHARATIAATPEPFTIVVSFWSNVTLNPWKGILPEVVPLVDFVEPPRVKTTKASNGILATREPTLVAPDYEIS